jgi:2',3'-cyclic-nucleotide 2'-phosphodiesterase (5'-nucleotidase family)
MWKFNPDLTISNGFRFCPPLIPNASGTADITKDYLYCVIPGDNNTLMADVTGKQIWDWMEKELENVFAKDPTRRFGGWLVRFKGMKINFTIANDYGKRLNSIQVKGKPIDLNKVYKVVSCEREGDPESLLCRIKDVKNNHKLGVLIHTVLEEYLSKFSPVSPKVEGRATATDAGPDLLTQVEGNINYQFR